jgi:ATP-dependent helicase/nuclease subunit B
VERLLQLLRQQRRRPLQPLQKQRRAETGLLDHTERRIKQLVTDLTAGCIRITPFRKGTESPCSWCDYRPLCRFDWQINNYNILNNIGKEEVLEKMKGH